MVLVASPIENDALDTSRFGPVCQKLSGLEGDLDSGHLGFALEPPQLLGKSAHPNQGPCRIIVDQLGVDEKQVSPEASFVDDLGADSLDTVELVMALEEEFDIEIPDEEAEKIASVQNAVDYIKSRTN